MVWIATASSVARRNPTSDTIHRPGLKTTVRSGGIPAAHPTVKDAANGSGGRDPQVPVSHPAVKDAAGGSGGNDPEVAIGSAKPRGEALRGPWGHRLLQHPLRLLQQSLTLGDPDPQHPLQHLLKHLPVARLQRQLVSPTRPALWCPWGPRPAASSAAAAAASRKAAAAAAAAFRRTRPNQQRTLECCCSILCGCCVTPTPTRSFGTRNSTTGHRTRGAQPYENRTYINTCCPKV